METEPAHVDLNAQKPVIWRVLLGVLLIYINAKNYLAPAPNLLKASNSTEQVGMNLGYFAMIGVGCWLIYTGTRPVWKRLR